MASKDEILATIASLASTTRVPKGHDLVFKDECVFSFRSPLDGGVYVNLQTFQAVSAKFLDLDNQRSGNQLYLFQKWTEVEKPKEEETQDAGADAPAPTKFAIGVDGGFDVDGAPPEILKEFAIYVYPSGDLVPYPDEALPEQVRLSVEAVLAHTDSNKMNVFKGWEEERKVSKYADTIEQLDNGVKISPNPNDWKCEDSGMTENLWLNLSTGYIGSGRQNWDGTGGTGAALKHFEATGSKYPLVVKLGTITPSGADVYSYAPDENDMVLDPHLAKHLSHWGINMMSMEKTEKTMDEINIDLNRNFEWDAIQENDKELEAVSGPGYTGLVNIGNSCYMNSLFQVLFSLPEFQKRYTSDVEGIFRNADRNVPQDINAQLAKLGVALLTDEYYKKDDTDDSKMETEDSNTVIKKLKPLMLRSALGRNHVEFSTSQQQDVHEYYAYFLEVLTRLSKRNPEMGEDLSKLFTFEIEERLECAVSHKVKYTTTAGENTFTIPIVEEATENASEIEAFKKQKLNESEKSEAKEPIPVIPFETCLAQATEGENISGFYSTATDARGEAIKTTRFKTFPPYLFVKMRRYVLAADWTPKKINASVRLPDDLDISHLRGTGKKGGEELLPEKQEAGPEPDMLIVSQLVAMGFSENGSKRAALAVNNSNAEAATSWVFEHMGDADFNDPLPAASAQGASEEVPLNEESVMMLVSMGFPVERCQKALRATDGNLERATDYLFSHPEDDGSDDAAAAGPDAKDHGIYDGEGKYELVATISHIGSNTHSGHYVCHVKKEGRWIIFNDRKVAISQDPPLGLGYMYLYKRKDYEV